MSNDGMTGVALKVPEQLISDLVRAEIVRVLSQSTNIVESMVEHVLSTKENSYDRETKFQKAFKAAVLNEAQDVVNAWIRENAHLIRDALLADLNRNKQKRLKEWASKLVDGMHHVYVRGISLDIGEGD